MARCIRVLAGLSALLLTAPGCTAAPPPRPGPSRGTPVRTTEAPPPRPAHARGTRADFDGDGRADLVAGVPTMRLGLRRVGPDLVLFAGTGHGLAAPGRVIAGFRPKELLEPSARLIVMDDVVSADINGDGYADLAYVTATQGPVTADRLMIMYGSRRGLRPGVEATFGSMPNDVAGMAAGDLDGDGRADLVFAQADTGSLPEPRTDLVIVRGGRHGLARQSVTHVTNGLRGFGTALAVGDMTGDGVADLVATNPAAWEEPTGPFPVSPTPRPPRKVQDARITVMPGTPHGPDRHRARYLTLRGGAMGVCRGPGPLWSDPRACLAGLVLTDLTGDGRADLVAVARGEHGRAGGDLLLFRSRGDVLAPPERLAAAGGTDGYQPPLAAGDGRTRLAAGRCGRDAQGYATRPRVTVFTGVGDRRDLDAAALGLTGRRAYTACVPGLALLDHDGDGRADLDAGSAPVDGRGRARIRTLPGAATAGSRTWTLGSGGFDPALPR